MSGCKESFTEKDIPDLAGYVAIVTGGNGGIGYETTRQLALSGARVYIAGRSAERVATAIQQMQESSPDKKLDLECLRIDLQDLKSVKEAAAEFLQKEKRLDLLINNAGVMTVPFKLTGDGYETQWQVNYMAPFVLVTELLPILLETADKTGSKDRVRVVNVSSDAVFMYGDGEVNLDDVNMTDVKGTTALWKRYSHSKKAAIRMSAALNERYSDKGITAYSLHPGLVRTGLQNHDPSLFGLLTRKLMNLSSTTPLKASYNTLYAATSPEAPAAAQGSFLMPVGKVEAKADRYIKDREGTTALWEWSLRAMEKVQ